MSDCKLTGSFGYFVQFMLFLIAFLSLLCTPFQVKQTERPKRQLKIWGLDVSKQAISAILAHFLNMLLAIIINSESKDSDECQWYFITFMLDTTLGVLICYFLLRAVDNQFEKQNLQNYKTGNYLVAVVLKDECLQSVNNSRSSEQKEQEQNYQNGKLGTFIKVDIKIWFIQMLIWNGIVLISKVILFICQAIFKIFFVHLTQGLFKPFEKYPDVELFLIMFFIPVTMNGFYFWIVDNFLKKQEITKVEERLGIGKQLYIENPSTVQLVEQK